MYTLPRIYCCRLGTNKELSSLKNLHKYVFSQQTWVPVTDDVNPGGATLLPPIDLACSPPLPPMACEAMAAATPPNLSAHAAEGCCLLVGGCCWA